MAILPYHPISPLKGRIKWMKIGNEIGTTLPNNLVITIVIIADVTMKTTTMTTMRTRESVATIDILEITVVRETAVHRIAIRAADSIPRRATPRVTRVPPGSGKSRFSSNSIIRCSSNSIVPDEIRRQGVVGFRRRQVVGPRREVAAKITSRRVDLVETVRVRP